VATKKEVEAKLRQMIVRLGEADDDVRHNLARTLPHRRTVQIDVTDLGTSYWTDLAGGRLGPLRKGEPEDADIKLRASSADLVAMIDGELGLLKSYLSGRVRIEASLSDLLALRKLA
jgi:predicted lipid carrier protein YhbT